MLNKMTILGVAALAGAVATVSNLWALDSTAFEPRPDQPTHKVLEDVAWRAAAGLVRLHRLERPALVTQSPETIVVPRTVIYAARHARI